MDGVGRGHKGLESVLQREMRLGPLYSHMISYLGFRNKSSSSNIWGFFLSVFFFLLEPLPFLKIWDGINYSTKIEIEKNLLRLSWSQDIALGSSVQLIESDFLSVKWG